MREINDIVEELISTVHAQECYVKYHEYLKRLKEDKELFAKVNEFRRKNLVLHMDQQSLREQTDLRMEHEDLLLNEEVRQFLYWEQKTTQMYRDINCAILLDSDLDCSFLE